MTRIWSQAKELAAQTPANRNRYVDFLRAMSILMVITGHWLVATVYYADGVFAGGKLTEVQPSTQWLTWIFQVMPIFFIVGGYSNAVSIESVAIFRIIGSSSATSGAAKALRNSERSRV